MATLSTTHASPSIFGGVMIIGGTIIGAGMFSLPVVMSGAWFFWSIAAVISDLVLYAAFRIDDSGSQPQLPRWLKF